MFKVGGWAFYHGEEVYVAIVGKLIGIVREGSAIIQFVPRCSLKKGR